MNTKARFSLKLNTEMVLRDKDGNIKKLFNPYGWVRWMIKAGILSPKHPQIPFVFGTWGYSLKNANLVTDAGKAAVAGLINGVVTDFFDFIAIGTGTTAPAAGNTTLEAEITTNGGQRASSTNTRVTTDVTNDTAQGVTTFAFTGSFAVTESGWLSASSGGTLLCRQTFSAINVVNGDSLQVTWKVDVD